VEAYQRYGPALLRKCQRMLQNRHDSEDIVQGLFVDLLRRGETDVDLPYLYRAVTNRCINHLKYGANRRRLLQQHDVKLRGPARLACDEQVIGVDLLVKLSRKLDREHTEVLVFRFFDEMTTRQIGRMVGTSRKTVEKRLRRIKDEVARLGNGGGEA